VRLINQRGELQSEPVITIGSVKQVGEGGLHGITLHPSFASNNFIYLYYTFAGSGNATLNRVVRYVYESGKLSDEKIIVDAIPGASNHDGGRIKFGPDGYLYITTGDAQNPSSAQNKDSLSGKILRVTDDGSPAPGNPFNNRVYSYGHRNPQGIAWDKDGNLWATEHGPSGIWPNCCQDEFNRIVMGNNYGWPDSVGDTVKEGTIGPVLHSGREIWAPAGLAYLNGKFYFAGLRGSALYEVAGATTFPALITHFKSEYGRLREVIAGPDGMLYVTTSNRDGRGIPKSGDDIILRINPTKL
jgi:glucose/arabinose dehydrogenase